MGAKIEAGSQPRPFVAIWPRGRGKSTHAEAIAVDLGAANRRTYCMVVSATQDQADKHVATIARMLESDGVTQFYPTWASRTSAETVGGCGTGASCRPPMASPWRPSG